MINADKNKIYVCIKERLGYKIGDKVCCSLYEISPGNKVAVFINKKRDGLKFLEPKALVENDFNEHFIALNIFREKKIKDILED